MKFFISSTFLDLKDYRRAAINMLSDLIGDREAATGQIGAMEFFSASENIPGEVCKDELSKSDIVIGIYGQRYGSPDPVSRLSMTEMEFDYAQKHGIPILAFIQQSDTVEAKQATFITNKVEKLETTYTTFVAIEEFMDKLNEVLKEYFEGFDGYSAKSLWSVIQDAKAEIEASEAEIPSEFQMEPYLSGQQDKALKDILFSAEGIQAGIPALACVNSAVSTYAHKYRYRPEQITQEDINQLKTEVESVVPAILSNWERIHLGLNNHTTHMILAASYLCLCQIQSRLLTENWTGALRKEALDVRERYLKCIVKSRYID